jgi:NitT/TauT family transport system substrate-binding protein
MVRRKSAAIFVTLIILMITLSSCSKGTPTEDTPLPQEESAPPTQSEPTKEPISTRLTMGYRPDIQFSPVYVALERGYFQDAGFDVVLEYGNEADAVALVGAGKQTFCVASGEQVLLARAQDLPVVFVAAWYQEYPVGVVSFAGSGLKAPGDLAGLDVGIPGLYGASYIGFKALLAAGNLTEEDVTLLPIGFNQVEALVAGQTEVAVIYLANEPAVLCSQGYEVDVLRVADYLQLVSNGLVTNEETLKENPQMVKDFVNAFLLGLSDTIADPEAAYEISKNYVENLDQADPVLQKEILAESIKLWGADRVGYSDPAGWENMQQVLLNMGLLTQPLDLEEAYTNEFLP